MSGQVTVAGPCTATLSYPVIPVQNSNSNVPLVVPVSASCSTNFGTQLYATGNAYDATSNTGLGTANAVLSSVNGGTEFTGQLGFNQFQAYPGDSIQISVSIYNSPGGNLVTTSGETIQTGTPVQPAQAVQQVTTTTVTGNVDPYPTANPANYQPNYQSNGQPYQFQGQTQLQNRRQQIQAHPSDQTHAPSQAFGQRSSAYLFDWMAIISIIAVVIIVTAALVLIAGRRQQPAWYPLPPPAR